MAPNRKTRSDVVERYGPAPDPCPCDFFFKGFICDWHADDELMAWRQLWRRSENN